MAAMAGRIDQQLMQRLQLKPAKLQSLINSAQSELALASPRSTVDISVEGRWLAPDLHMSCLGKRVCYPLAHLCSSQVFMLMQASAPSQPRKSPYGVCCPAWKWPTA